MKKKRRVVISGLGVVAPNGIGKDAFWEALVAGKSAVDWITSFDTSKYSSKVAAEVKDFRPNDFMSSRKAAQWGRFSKLAVAASRLALQDSGLDLSRTPAARVHACIGNSLNGSGDVYDIARAAFEKEELAAIPRQSGFEFAAHAAASHVCTEIGVRGQGLTIASACATGLDVIQWALAQIQADRADIVFAGSTEAPVSEFCFATLCALRGALCTFDEAPLRGSRPFDLKRQGLVLGEGAATCVLEEMDHALDRGAPIYAEVLGFGAGNEGGRVRQRDVRARALAQAITTALSQAELTPDCIDYVNLHGNSMRDYDLIDTKAFRMVLGRAADNIPFSSIKSMIGHAMGAAAAFQVVSTCLTLVHGVIPPTINYEFPDTECDLDYVPNVRRVSRARTALINAHAIGGTYSVLALGTPDRR